MGLLSRPQVIKENKNQFNVGWVPQSSIALVDQVSNSSESGLSLNAMPTPFARAEVVREAFEAVSGCDFKTVGLAYQTLVSDTLDVLEILFNYNLYSDCVRIYKRRVSEFEIPQPANDDEKNTAQYLQKALRLYRKDDEIYVITYVQNGSEYAIAMSWPDTMFFTSSRLDRRGIDEQTGKVLNEYGITIPRKGNGTLKNMFEGVVPLKKRDQRFQDYLYHLYASNRDKGFGNTAIGRFIAQLYGAQRQDNFDELEVAPVLDHDGNNVVLRVGNARISLKQNNIPTPDAIFRNEIVSIGYSINKDKFVTLQGPNNDSCLLPLNLESFSRLPHKNFVDAIEYTGMFVRSGGYELQATKCQSQLSPFDIGIYPFFKYPQECLNDRVATYHIILSYVVPGVTPYQDNVTMQFFNAEGEQLRTYTREEYNNVNNGVTRGVIEEIRTNLFEGNQFTRTVHYTVVGSNFDYIQVNIKTPEGEKRGVLKPKFTTVQQSDEQIKFAVDFGTTSTFVAVREGGQEPQPLVTNEESMVYLHQGQTNGANASVVYKYEQYGGTVNSGVPVGTIPSLVKLIKNEFIPSSIGAESYKFPIRTAVSHKSQGAIEDIFEDANIAFTYDKENIVGNNVYKTNIKWEVENNQYSSAYIREIVRICIIHALSKSYKVSNIQFLTFYPLAMNEDIRTSLETAWTGVCREFGIEQKQFKSITESLAPYYAGTHPDNACVASIDIGGGSVDTVVYKDGRPRIAMSSLFGCDVLWGNGRATATNAKDNPIYISLKDSISDRLDGELKEIHGSMVRHDSRNSSSDIINFWLSNDVKSQVSAKLALTQNHPIYIAHFYAVVYHLAQAMKVKELGIPVEISLSGNGSSYLNYINKPGMLSTIATTAFNDVYDNCGINDIRVNLPSDFNRRGKEMTAYGGLEPVDFPNVDPYIFAGLHNGDKNIVMRAEVDEDVIASICKNVDQLQKNIKALLTRLRMPIGDIQDLTLGEIRTTLINARDEHQGGSKYFDARQRNTSTLFFAPVQQLIFDIEKKIFEN